MAILASKKSLIPLPQSSRFLSNHAVALDEDGSHPSRGTSRFPIWEVQRACGWHPALEQLEKVATIPGVPELVPTYGDLRFNPCWDDLRGHKRFDKIVAVTKAASK